MIDHQPPTVRDQQILNSSSRTTTTAQMESPFSEHLYTNYAPTEAEVKLIRAHLVPHEAALAQIESKLRALSAERARLQEHIEAHQALLSYPRRIPQDIVEDIFLSCLPTQRNATINVAEAPLLLCQICSAWRSVALGMPRLWTTLHIGDGPPRRWSMVGDWLGRSAALPLALSLSLNRTDPEMEILRASSERW
ncbi:hypothetical protein C8R44DRAFT_720358 [Mycena epipterygia]|nr:hypothetical protein C8R44DRAFT_720358 [Mycena epipterygia]